MPSNSYRCDHKVHAKSVVKNSHSSRDQWQWLKKAVMKAMTAIFVRGAKNKRAQRVCVCVGVLKALFERLNKRHTQNNVWVEFLRRAP